MNKKNTFIWAISCVVLAILIIVAVFLIIGRSNDTEVSTVESGVVDVENTVASVEEVLNVDKKAEPVQKPTESTHATSKPTQKPTEPTEEPTEATQKSTEPTQRPTEPTQKPTEPAQAPNESTQKPTEDSGSNSDNRPPMPNDGNEYFWDSAVGEWILVDNTPGGNLGEGYTPPPDDVDDPIIGH